MAVTCSILQAMVHEENFSPIRWHGRENSQNVKQMLDTLTNETQTSWDDHLPYAMTAHQVSKHESIKCAPCLIVRAISQLI